MKNVLIISSSPRKKENSQILCEKFKKVQKQKDIKWKSGTRTYHGVEYRFMQSL